MLLLHTLLLFGTSGLLALISHVIHLITILPCSHHTANNQRNFNRFMVHPYMCFFLQIIYQTHPFSCMLYLHLCNNIAFPISFLNFSALKSYHIIYAYLCTNLCKLPICTTAQLFHLPLQQILAHGQLVQFSVNFTLVKLIFSAFKFTGFTSKCTTFCFFVCFYSDAKNLNTMAGTIPRATLNDGKTIPVFGLGTWKVNNIQHYE